MDFNVRVLGIIVCLEVLVVVVFNVGTLVRGGPSGYPTESFTWEAFTSGPVAVGALFAISIFLVFETTAVYREEVRDPDRTIPRATYVLVVIMSLFYGLFAWCLITALGADSVVGITSTDPAGSFLIGLDYAVGQSFSQIVSVLLITTVLATQLSIANASARYLYSFSVDGVLPQRIAVTHERYGSPHRAAIVCAAIVTGASLILIGIGADPQDIYIAFTGVCTFAFEFMMLLVSLAVLVYFRRNRAGGESPWKVVVAPAVSAACFGWLTYFTATHSELVLGKPTAWVSVFFVLMAAIFVAGLGYAVWLARRRPDIFRRIGRVDDSSPLAD
jgi:amino acid transporter